MQRPRASDEPRATGPYQTLPGESQADAPQIGQSTERNRLLRALPAESYARLTRELESIQLQSAGPVWEPDEPIRWVYFPRSCVISLVVPFKEGRAIEAATIGREGVAGATLALGGHSTSTKAFGQVPVDAARLAAARFREALAADGALATLVLRYTQALLEQTAQSVACNRKHVTVQRCARWILMTADSVGANQLGLTQEFLAQMLGVRRASVSTAAETLKRAGLIRYSRGKISILDRARLEAVSCECYLVVKERHQRLFGEVAA
jgi:CRP-like cAMP-binding protein